MLLLLILISLLNVVIPDINKLLLIVLSLFINNLEFIVQKLLLLRIL